MIKALSRHHLATIALVLILTFIFFCGINHSILTRFLFLSPIEQLIYSILALGAWLCYKWHFLPPSPPNKTKAVKDLKEFEQTQLLIKQLRYQWFYLKKTIPFKHQDYPCHLMIGLKGSGRSSLLNATESFQEVIPPIPNNQLPFDISFWHSSESILCLVSPRLINTQESQHSQHLFKTLIKSLQQKYFCYPFSAIHLIFPLASLRSSKKVDQTRDVDQFNYLLSAIQPKKLTIPTNIILTHCDRIAGFAPFFESLDDNARNETWAIHLDPTTQFNEQQYLERFNHFVQQLNQNMIKRLHQESQHHRLCLIKDFPIQIEKLRTSLLSLLSQLSTKPSYLIGQIKFVSATQDGRYIDYLKSSLVKDQHSSVPFHASPFVLNQSYFCQPSLTTYWAKLQNTNATLVKHRFYIQPKVWLIVFAIVLASQGYIYFSYAHWLSKFFAEKQDPTKHTQTFIIGERHTELWQQYANLLEKKQWVKKHPLPTFYGKTLVSWQQELTKKIDDNKRDLLTKAVENFFQYHFNTVLNQPNLLPIELHHQLYSYESLLTESSKDKPKLMNWLVQNWQIYLNKEQIAYRRNSLAPIINQVRLKPIKTDVLRNVNQHLNELSWSEEAELILTDHITPTLTITPNNTAYEQSPYSSLATLYSKTMLNKVMTSIIPNICLHIAHERNQLLPLINPNGKIQQCTQASQKNYLHRYLQNWYQMTNSITVRFPDDLAQRAHFLSQAIHHKLNIQQWLQTAKEQIAATNPYDNLIEDDDLKVKSTINTIASLLHSYVMTNALQKLSEQSQKLAEDQYGQYAFKNALEIMNTSASAQPIVQLHELIDEMPPFLKQIFMPLANQAWHDMLSLSSKHINTVWQLTVYKFYQQHLVRYFPFTENALEDAQLRHFKTFFRPKGIVDLYTAHYLSPFLIQKDHQVTWKTRFNQKIVFNTGLLDILKSLHHVQEMFFSQQDLMSRYTLIPSGPLNSDIQTISLNINGKLHTITKNTRQVWLLHWPVHGDQTVGLVVKNRAGQSIMTSRHGPWALFRLINTAVIDPNTDPKRPTLTFPIQNMAIKFSIIPENDLNPFQPHLFAHFTLPNSITVPSKQKENTK